MAYDKEHLEAFEEILIQVIETTTPVRDLIKEYLPSVYSFYKIVDNDDQKAEQYARAMQIRADLLANEIIEISDDSSNDTITIVKNGNEIEIEDKEWVNRSRLRVDSRKWIASKLLPKKYGDKLDLNHSGKVENEIIVKRPTKDENKP